MPIGEFTKYGLVFGSSLIGAVSGYFYSSKPLNLRMRMERNGTRLLRPSDDLWMYKRNLKQKKKELKEIKEIAETTTQPSEAQSTTQKPENDVLKKLKEFADATTTEPTDEQAIALLNWCQDKLTNPDFNSSRWVKDVTDLCEFPRWSE